MDFIVHTRAHALKFDQPDDRFRVLDSGVLEVSDGETVSYLAPATWLAVTDPASAFIRELLVPRGE
jgi:hypothetical protein